MSIIVVTDIRTINDFCDGSLAAKGLSWRLSEWHIAGMETHPIAESRYPDLFDFKKANDCKQGLAQEGEIKSSYLQARLIETLMTGAASAFVKARDAIFKHKHNIELLNVDQAISDLCQNLKNFAREHAYQHSAVLKQELQGAIAITKLLDLFWEAIQSRGEKSAFNRYVYKLISDNYRCEFERKINTGT